MGRTLRFGLWGWALSLTACTAELGFDPEPDDGSDAVGVGGSVQGNGTGAAPSGGGQGLGGDDSDGAAGSPPDGDPTPISFQCDPKASLAGVPLRRLTEKQYRNTLRDLLSMVLESTSEANEVISELDATLQKLTPDDRPRVPGDLHGSYRRLDQRVQQSHVDVWYEVAAAAGKALTSGDRATKLVGDCTDAACVDDVIRKFGRLALRRPLSDADVTLYRAFYGTSTELELDGIADVVAGFLNAPDFLYMVESGGDKAGAHQGSYQLTGYELAARLSYHFWNTMPDERLLELAESGKLLEDATYEAEAERLWLDSRTEGTLRDFFREWLKVEDLPELDRNNDATIFQNFAGDNLPSEELRGAMQDETLDLLSYFTWTAPSALGEIFQTPLNFARSEELASLYGAEAWDGKSVPDELPDARPGLLTRAAFLATGTANTRPIMKGVFIRTNVLCDTIDPPPNAAAANPPDLSPTFTTREVVEELTGSGICADCHQTFINGLGFATEGFDSLGRARTEQVLFDSEGEQIGRKAVHFDSIPQVNLGDMRASTGPDDLMRMIAESGKLEACFSRHYFRFTLGRFEDVNQDGCALERMRTSLAETGSVADMLLDVALSDEFRTRAFGSVNN